MIKYPNKNLDECKELCSQNKNCVAFEYGVAYGGGGTYKSRDCQLSDSAEKQGCDGSDHNTDLYVRGTKNVLEVCVITASYLKLKVAID